MSKKNRKQTTPKQTQVHPWFPKSIDKELIPAIRSLGRSGISLVEGDPTPFGKTAKLRFGKTPETSEEHRANRIVDQPLRVGVAAALANGPKLFVIPPDMIDHLNQIEIPIKVSDYEQPFPAVIVKNGAEYHIVLQLSGRLFCVTEKNGFIDSCSFLNMDSLVELYLSSPQSTGTVQIEPNQFANVLLNENISVEHRFRATLNFLLLIMTGGFVRERETSRSKRRSIENVTSKYTTPEVFQPQDIALWRNRLITANQRKEPNEAMGSKKRTHWRRVAVGIGRTDRELRLIAACLVNKQFLAGSSDSSDSDYTVS